MADPYAGLGTPVQGAQPDPYAGLGTAVQAPPGSVPVDRQPDGSLKAADGTVYSSQGVGPQGEQHALIDGSAPVTAAGVAGQGARGLVDSGVGMANQVVNMALPNPLHFLDYMSDASNAISGILGIASGNGKSAPPQIQRPATMGTEDDVDLGAPLRPWINQQPANIPERVARTVMMAAPAAFGSETAEGLISQLGARAWSVGAPAGGSLIARGVTNLLGGDQNAQDTAGNLGLVVGGVAGRLGVQPGAPAPDLPEGVAADGVSPKDINRAVNYVVPRLKNPDPVMVAADQAGKPVTLGQLAGEQGVTAVRTLARRPGQTSVNLNTYAGSSREPDPNAQGIIGTSPQRTLDYVSSLTGITPAAAQGDMDALSESLRANNVSPAYDAALAGPVNRTQQLASVLQEPDVQTALGYAMRKVGTNATEHGPIIDPDTGFQVIDPNTKEPLFGPQPNATTLDLTKKYLGKMVERDQFTKQPIMDGEKGIGNGFVLDNLKRLTTALAGDSDTPAAIPGYRNALKQSGDVLSMEQAYKHGQGTLFNSTVPADQFGAVVGNLGPADLKAAQAGGANALFGLAQKSLLNGGKFTPQVQGKLQALYGPDVTQRILEGLNQEKAIISSLNRMRPANQSATASDTAEMNAQDSASPILQHGGEFILNSVLGGWHVAVAKLGLNVAKPAIQGLLGKIGEMPEQARDVAGGLLLSPTIRPADLDSYLAAARAARPRIGFRGVGLLPGGYPQQPQR